MNSKIKIFLSSFVHAVFVAANTYFISTYIPAAVFVTTFINTMIFTYNMKKVIIGTEPERWSYGFGAACGCTIGLILSHSIKSIF